MDLYKLTYLLGFNWNENKADAKLASAAAAILLETQLESIPQNMTGAPKSQKRLYFDQQIPEPNITTIPAWQSICQLAFWPNRLVVNSTIFDFGACFVLPTLADSSHETGSPGILPPSHPAIMRDGYGMFSVILALWNKDLGWRLLQNTRFDQDVSVPGYELLFQILNESSYMQPLSRKLVRDAIVSNAEFDSGNLYNLCPLYSAYLKRADTKRIFADRWGIDLGAQPTRQFERLMAEHSVGFRFSGQLVANPWIHSYCESLLQQYSFVFNGEESRKMILAGIDQTWNQWSRRVNKGVLPELETKLESLETILGL